MIEIGTIVEVDRKYPRRKTLWEIVSVNWNDGYGSTFSQKDLKPWVKKETKTTIV